MFYLLKVPRVLKAPVQGCDSASFPFPTASKSKHNDGLVTLARRRHGREHLDRFRQLQLSDSRCHCSGFRF